MKKLLLGMCGLVALPSVSFAQEAPYVDDRSSASAVVRSLYNAVNRKEYARAWSYYGDQKPAKNLEEFAKGYKDTANINLAFGRTESEGAAGSIFYNLPVAIEAFAADGSSKVFAGCYTARLANPQIQDANFTPLHIEKGSLKRSDKGLQEAVPANCGGAEPQGDDAVLAQAKSAFITTNAPTCDQIDTQTGLPQDGVQDYTIKYKEESDTDSDPERITRLIGFACTMGAYNLSTIFYQWDDLNGLRQLSFAMPTMDIAYEEDGNTESPVHSITVNGFEAADQLVNPEFDAKTNTLTSFAKWRGVGDASANGTWAFKNGSFVLVKYDVDASYDGEINPQTVVDYDSPP
ncbi:MULTISPECIES: DUF1176 domain-containing protein [Mesorhizobium]|uniref:DUF1176 domain-containing protein n=1 Tax=Mesorhizobium denitrificans TaxID=2294114 RepID=A0A371X6M7_9HYPH|nr:MULTISPECIES: DUF1176 domain-containing protein [Mesorhizobium]RFC64882.1 DUF1176 domain-containing protein [Mesorhizobium denitrificans]